MTIQSQLPRLVAALCLVGLGCPSDDSDANDDAADTGADDDGGPGDDDGGSADESAGDDGVDDGSPGMCGDGGEDNLFYEPPGECYNNMGCGTCNCRTFRDNPPSMEASCADDPGDDTMLITATLLEFPGDTTIPTTDVSIYNAFEVGTVGPDNATAIGMVSSDGDGRIETSVVPMDQIGIVATVRADGFVDTATGLAKPPWEPSNAIHDVFAVRQADADAWSAQLAMEAELADALPLGENGGVVGVARNRYTGTPVAGVRIVSLTNGADTPAVLRYLNEDGTFNADATTATGVYVLLNPQLAEEFEAEMDGAIVSTRANRAGSGAPAVFTMNLTVNADPGENPFE